MCAVLCCWDSYSSVGDSYAAVCAHALIPISYRALQTQRNRVRERERDFHTHSVSQPASQPVRHTHSTRSLRCVCCCCCFIYSIPLLNVFIAAAASFLLTLTFVRAHPSVKLGTFTRLDTKKWHSSTKKLYTVKTISLVKQTPTKFKQKRTVEIFAKKCIFSAFFCYKKMFEWFEFFVVV